MFSADEIMTSLLEIQYGGVCGSGCQVSGLTHPFRLLWLWFVIVGAIIYLLRANIIGTNTRYCPIFALFVDLTSWTWGLGFIRCFRSILWVNSKTKTKRHHTGDIMCISYATSRSCHLYIYGSFRLCIYGQRSVYSQQIEIYNRQLLFAQPLRTTC